MFANQNMDEETLFELPSFRKHLSEMGIALIWFAPMLEQQWDVKTGVQQSFDNTLRALAEVSGYDEIRAIPISERCFLKEGSSKSVSSSIF